MNNIETMLNDEINAGNYEKVLATLQNLKENADKRAAELKAQEEAKRAAEQAKAERGFRITEIANRALQQNLTNEDVAWILLAYVSQTHKNIPDVLREGVFTGKGVDDLIDSLFSTNDLLTELANTLFGHTFSDKPKTKAKKTADEIIHEFLNTL